MYNFQMRSAHRNSESDGYGTNHLKLPTGLTLNNSYAGFVAFSGTPGEAGFQPSIEMNTHHRPPMASAGHAQMSKPTLSSMHTHTSNSTSNTSMDTDSGLSLSLPSIDDSPSHSNITTTSLDPAKIVASMPCFRTIMDSVCPTEKGVGMIWDSKAQCEENFNNIPPDLATPNPKPTQTRKETQKRSVMIKKNTFASYFVGCTWTSSNKHYIKKNDKQFTDMSYGIDPTSSPPIKKFRRNSSPLSLSEKKREVKKNISPKTKTQRTQPSEDWDSYFQEFGKIYAENNRQLPSMRAIMKHLKLVFPKPKKF
ncbi:hypothetical protein RFI_08976 [Reticulomyxa filosa]|uniref:Uncharacterized protein n=1 Tax=Reticulomyxa filosa TaxID=46433 RepID=X6NS38_RETFI|nr:hypothetical protein RFI_08976 [Reticulomyxa filosa]|eukprot:ETO28157.1 hypothetical protein RFI_08976 [Reticulomyxa filosa]